MNCNLPLLSFHIIPKVQINTSHHLQLSKSTFCGSNLLSYIPLMSFPKPMEDVTALLLLLFSLRTSSSLDISSKVNFFLLFFFLCRGGSFLGKVNMGKMTSNMATAHSRKPLHLHTQAKAIFLGGQDVTNSN